MSPVLCKLWELFSLNTQGILCWPSGLYAYVDSAQQTIEGIPVQIYEALFMHSSLLSRTRPWISGCLSLPKLPALSPQLREARLYSLPYSCVLQRKLGNQRVTSVVSLPPRVHSPVPPVPQSLKTVDSHSSAWKQSVPFSSCLFMVGGKVQSLLLPNSPTRVRTI